MDKNKKILIEIGLLAIAAYFMFFVQTNVNPTLGGIYQGLIILGGLLLIADTIFGRKSLDFINDRISWGTAFIYSMIAYVILIGSSYFISSISNIIPLTELLKLLQATSPVFSNSVSINFIIFALVIPFIETYVIFFISLDLFSSMFNINLNKFSTGLIILIAIIMMAFLIFHVQAKSLENENALLLVGVMAGISCILIIMTHEARIAIAFHIICNLIALLPMSVISGIG